MHKKLFFLVFICSTLSAFIENYCDLKSFDKGVVEKTKDIVIPGVENPFNPSMVPFDNRILMAFRNQPSLEDPWISNIYLVFLDKSFNLCSDVQTLDMRLQYPHIPSYAEDPRLFWLNDRLFLIYNDNLEDTREPYRREMYISELIQEEENFVALPPTKLKHPTNYPHSFQEKNWVPFNYSGEMLLAYTLKPHEILLPDERGNCSLLCKTEFLPPSSFFDWGELRGGTPALKINEQNYLAFFHSFTSVYSSASKLRKIPHYFCGAYLFSSEPPFEIQAISPYPLVGKDFYKTGHFHKRVIYPAGFIQEGNHIYLCCGRDDRSIFVATLNLQKLLASLVIVKNDE